MITYNVSALPYFDNRYDKYHSSNPRTNLSIIATGHEDMRAKALSLLRKLDKDWYWTIRVDSIVETPDPPEPVILEAVSDRPRRPKPAHL